MRQALNLGMVAAAAATSILSLPGSSAFAASGADGQAAGSPGILSGNTVQAPVDVPVNACGNSVDVVGALNPASGNSCANEGGSRPVSAQGTGSDRAAAPSSRGNDSGGAHAGSETAGSPGILSGNSVQAPVDAPVNVCGNTVDVTGVANPAMGNGCSDGVAAPEDSSEAAPPAVRSVEPPVTKQPPAAQGLTEPEARAAHVMGGHERLAQTGTDQNVLAAAAASAALLIGGGILYRRGRGAAG
ncbi:chaplin [Streptomyces sp. NPDC046821]|uniref:chaplin n=1 Tax=Streptomyces sp. NPDC046821 TaxID=3154702 RepID=UPI0033DE1D99